MFKLSLLIVRVCFKQMMKFVPCRAPVRLTFRVRLNPLLTITDETLWKTPITLCKNPWPVYGLSIIFSASSFPVIIKFQPATCNLQPAKIPAALNYRVCSICLSFFCIVYNTKLQHGDPDVRITLLRYFQAITKQSKGTSASFWSCTIRQSSILRSRKLSARLLWKGERHFIQYNTGKWSLTNLPSDFLI